MDMFYALDLNYIQVLEKKVCYLCVADKEVESE
jgi:hypothetical protein